MKCFLGGLMKIIKIYLIYENREENILTHFPAFYLGPYNHSNKLINLKNSSFIKDFFKENKMFDS